MVHVLVHDFLRAIFVYRKIKLLIVAILPFFFVYRRKGEMNMGMTDRQLAALKAQTKRYMTCVDRGLYLETMPSGHKYWRVRFRRDEKEEKVTLGEYPLITLAEARELCTALKKEVMHGGMPKNILNPPAPVTFGQVAQEWYTTKIKEIRTDGHARTIFYRLRAYLLPTFENRPIKEITSKELLIVLLNIKTRNSGTHGTQGFGTHENGTHTYTETIRKTRQIAGQVFKYAIAMGECEHNIATDLEGALPTSTQKHYAALTKPREIKDLMLRMECYNGTQVVRAALEFSLRTFQRPGEVRRAEWDEIDFGATLWTIPEKKMKKNRLHIVPLATQVIALLKNLMPLTGRGKYIFPADRVIDGSRPMSENTIRIALRTMGYTNDEMTPHGFRTLASTNLNGQGWNGDLIELQLAHQERNKVRAAYNHADKLPERIKMMQHWSNWLDELKNE
jgi:integrase